MAFADTQIRKLRSKLKPRHVRQRDADGLSLHYLEGWHVMAEANRIFGFDGWDRETVASTCVWTRQVGTRYCAAYVTRVRISVRAGEDKIIREGCGAGDSNATSPGQAHEFAAKAAETDATKRALSTFGNAFGLSLYGGASDQAGRRVVTGAGSAAASTATAMASASSLAPSTGAAADVTAEVVAANAAPIRSQARAMAATVALPAMASPVAAISTTAEQPGSAAVEALHCKSPALAALTPDGVGPFQRRPVDKSVLAIPEPKRLRDADHLRFVATHPCIICGRQPTEAHHLKFTQPSAIGRKVSDAFTVPLCALHHRDLHTTGNELSWWERRNTDPLPVAGRLWAESHGWPQEADTRSQANGSETS